MNRLPVNRLPVNRLPVCRLPVRRPPLRRPPLGRLSRGLLSLLLVAASAPAMAQDDSDDGESDSAHVVRTDRPHEGSRPVTLDVHAGLALFGPGVSAGLRLGLPLVNNGFVSTINNAVYLTLGADFYYSRYFDDLGEKHFGAGVGIPLGIHWEFYFTEKWSAFVELGLNIYLPPSFLAGGDFGSGGGAWVMAMVGGKLHFSEHSALLIRIGTPATYVGLSFMF